MIRAFLDMLFGAEPSDSLCELRWKPKDVPMRNEFIPARAFGEIAARTVEHAEEGDSYIGLAPRVRTSPQTGGRDAIERSHVLWVDCDSEMSLDVLRCFDPRPAFVIRSGSGGVHAYWPLLEPVSASDCVRANKRLAHHLAADAKATDAPRILRPPGTLNWKHDPPKPVEVAHMESQVFKPMDVVGDLPDPIVERRAPKPHAPTNDLERIPAEVYFERLTGQVPDVTGKVRCPVPDHFDRTPSCHLYEFDWTCFGCGATGGIYWLAAHAWGIEPRGDGFKEILSRLELEFGLVPV